LNEKRQEGKSPFKNLFGLRKTFYLAEEVGKGLGSGKVLQQSLRAWRQKSPLNNGL
jgi:hypothetical protein